MDKFDKLFPVENKLKVHNLNAQVDAIDAEEDNLNKYP